MRNYGQPLAVSDGGTGSRTASAARAALGINSAGQLAFRNRIINGGFAVNQRGYPSGASLAAGAHGHDRWKAGAAGAYTFAQAYPTCTVTITSGTLQQVVESSAMEGGAYALSWTGTAQGRLTYTAQGASSATTTAYGASPLLLTNLAAGASVTVEFGAGSGSGGVTLGQVQLEPGTAASAFELRPLAVETALCQRYFVQWTTTTRADLATGLAYSTTAAVFPVALPVPMRATPAISSSTIAVLNGSGGQINGSSQAIQAATDKTVEIAIGAGGLTLGQASVLTIGTGAGGYLSLSAEL